MKKRGLLIIAGCFLSLCLLTGCGKKEDNREAVVTQTLEEIYTQMETNVELPTMVRLEDDYITNYYGADLSTFDEYVFAAAEDALLAENIILVKMKDGESNEAVVKLLNNIIKQKKTELESYLPEQYKIVEKSEVVTNGDYVVLIISSKKAELLEQLPDALK
ncbi:MAG: DUF4358 domain-containing protein [Lachnospiraceae bacterium]